MGTSKWSARRAVRIFGSAYLPWVRRIPARTQILLLAATSLSACSALGTRFDVSAARQREHLAELVQFAAYVRTLDESELQRDYRSLQTEHRASPSSDTAVKLSLLLSYSAAPPDALVEALQLLSDVSDGNTDDAAFARLVYDLISERYAATASNGSLTDLLLQERTRSQSLRDQLIEIEASLADTQRQRAALAQQLDALKAVEEQISVDDNGSQPSPQARRTPFR